MKQLYRELENYERFCLQLSTVVNKYCAKHSDLVGQIAELRANFVSQSKTQSVVSVFDSPMDNIQDLQLSKKLYRRIAMLAHPDRGGDPLLFNYAHALYTSHDVTALSHLLESLLNNDFSSYTQFIRQKLNALYEVAKSKPSYLILLADSKGQYELADQLCVKSLRKSIDLLKNSR